LSFEDARLEPADLPIDDTHAVEAAAVVDPDEVVEPGALHAMTVQVDSHVVAADDEAVSCAPEDVLVQGHALGDHGPAMEVGSRGGAGGESDPCPCQRGGQEDPFPELHLSTLHAI
jgi:hypothetical protein